MEHRFFSQPRSEAEQPPFFSPDFSSSSPSLDLYRPSDGFSQPLESSSAQELASSVDYASSPLAQAADYTGSLSHQPIDFSPFPQPTQYPSMYPPSVHSAWPSQAPESSYTSMQERYPDMSSGSQALESTSTQESFPHTFDALRLSQTAESPSFPRSASPSEAEAPDHSSDPQEGYDPDTIAFLYRQSRDASPNLAFPLSSSEVSNTSTLPGLYGLGLGEDYQKGTPTQVGRWALQANGRVLMKRRGGIHAATPEQLREWRGRGGAVSVERGVGVHAATPEQLREWAKKGGNDARDAKLNREFNREYGDFVDLEQNQ